MNLIYIEKIEKTIKTILADIYNNNVDNVDAANIIVGELTSLSIVLMNDNLTKEELSKNCEKIDKIIKIVDNKR